MTLLKCKMCGGEIQAIENQAYGTCDSCGSTMTLPSISDERKANLHNRANHYRQQNEFDKALAAYESILAEDSNDAEAHWGVVLSKYGIEYVDDPKTHKRVPTCHRVQAGSILSDLDYKAAIEKSSDGYTQSLYEQEAQAISEIQKRILVVSNNETPYDVFICYKETDATGKRTVDSTLAQDIYYHLEKEGLRVFFSRITLEDKLGTEYEPYIFAALNSAKVMLVVGTKPEYFNAVWVKNEWSRFVSLAKKNREKLIIPCYRDMDAYDLPDELSMFQSQDMSKIGFIQDLVRGVKKVTEKNTSATASGVATTVTASAAPGVESLLKRGNQFLEDGEWNQASDYFNRVLDIDPEYAPAHIGNLCAALSVNNEEHLVQQETPLTEHSDYKKAVRFANTNYRVRMEELNRKIEERIEMQMRTERERTAEKNRQQAENAKLEQEKYEADKQAKFHIAHERATRMRMKYLPLVWCAEIIALISGSLFVLYFFGNEFSSRPMAYSDEEILITFSIGITCVVLHFIFFCVGIHRKSSKLGDIARILLWVLFVVTLFFMFIGVSVGLDPLTPHIGYVAALTASCLFVSTLIVCIVLRKMAFPKPNK